MKKFNRSRLRHRLNAARRRLEQAKRPKGLTGGQGDLNQVFLNPKPPVPGATSHVSTPRIQAPPKLDIYSGDNFGAFCNFLNNLEQASRYNDRVIICFRNTHRITAAAALRLLASVSNLLSTYENLSFGCSIPSRRSGHKYKQYDRVIEGVLQQIGFFKMIGQPERTPTKRADIAAWSQLSGELADGSLAASLLNSLPPSITKKAKAQLYKGAIEAMANSVDHAYPRDENGAQLKENRWWMLVGRNQEKITLIVCDLGVGIPVTLPKKHPESMLRAIFQKCRILGNSDAEMIHASTFIKRTRTHQTHRGKGGADIRSITEHFPGALLSIRSNRGCYIVAGEKYPGTIRPGYAEIDGSNGREWSASYSHSICGTLIEWTVSLKELEA